MYNCGIFSHIAQKLCFRAEKVGNERFVANAKPEVVDGERKKKADAESKIASLKEGIAALQK